MNNLVFTSAGNNTEFYKNWISPDQKYDIFVIYYGDDEEKFNLYKEKVKFIEKRKGSKFQNFHYFYNKYSEIINQYNYFFILDDDIIFNSNDINSMFFYAKNYNLLICQPSFDKKSIISHNITKHKSNLLLAYTNFIEVNVPLFNKDAIDKLMSIYDPILIGWGIDFLYMQINDKNLKNKFAIIHKIKCINPEPIKKINKNDTRELSLINNWNNRQEIWIIFSKKKKFKECYDHRVYSKIYLI
jgi:hypothetical protein